MYISTYMLKIKNNKRGNFRYVKPTKRLSIKTNFEIVDQYTGVKWHKTPQEQPFTKPELSYRIS